MARTAGLNPNTFYRHFRNFDELGLAVVDQFGSELRKGLRERRALPARAGFRLSDMSDPAGSLQRVQTIVRESVALVLDYVAEHREAYVVGIRELHGSSPVMRKALRQMLNDLSSDMAEDILNLLQLPFLRPETVREISGLVIRQMTFFTMDYLDQPERREQIRGEAERFILLLFWGALATEAPGLLANTQLLLPES